MLRRWLYTGCWIITAQLSGQGITDSVFYIGQVEVLAERTFLKEEAGMKIERVDTLVMENQVYHNLSSLLAENSAVYIKDYGRGALSTASFRGASPTHTQVTWNGINMNSPMLGMVDFSLIPMFIIDETILEYGAASIASQSGGLGGLISIGTKANWKNRFSTSLNQSAGSFHTFDNMLKLGVGSPAFQSATRLYHNYSRNDYPYRNDRVPVWDSIGEQWIRSETKNIDAAYRKYGLAQDFFLRASDRTILSWRTWIQEAGRSIPTVLSSEMHDEAATNKNRQDDRTLKTVIGLEHFSDQLSMHMLSGLDLQQLDYRMTTYISGLDPAVPVNSGSEMLSWHNRFTSKYELSEKIAFRVNTSLAHHRITTLDSASQAGYDAERTEGSLLGGLHLWPASAVQLSGQLRKDFIPGSRTPLVFSFGFNLRPDFPPGLVIRGSVARNYRHPSLNDLYWQPGGNPDLLPEEGYTAELGADLGIAGEQLSLEGSVTGYYSKISNWILWLPSIQGYWEPLNIKTVRAFGVESRWKAGWAREQTSASLHGGFAVALARNFGASLVQGDLSAGKQLPFIPKVSGNLLFVVSHRGYYLKYQHQTVGSRYLLSSNQAGLDDDSREVLGWEPPQKMQVLYPHFLNEMAIGKQIGLGKSDLTLELKIENLFNENYRNILQRFMPGRHYLMMISYDFKKQ